MLDSLEEIEAASIKDPMRVASLSIKSQLRKRFYKDVSIGKPATGFNILLDNRPVKTPSGELLTTPNLRVGELVSREWNAQEEVIDPQTMPVTRLINTSIDGVAKDMQPVKDDIIRFVGSDLLCYRADSPIELVSNQQRCWDPLLGWTKEKLGAEFSVQTGIMHVAQPDTSIAIFGQRINAVDCPATLTALHSLTAITGSAIIALALHEGEIDGDLGWSAAYVDEDWQISQWGEDHDASALRAARTVEYDAAIQLLAALEKT